MPVIKLTGGWEEKKEVLGPCITRAGPVISVGLESSPRWKDLCDGLGNLLDLSCGMLDIFGALVGYLLFLLA